VHGVASLSANTRQRVIHEAASCIGTPFHLNQRTKYAGMDCAGLIWHVLESCGLYFPEYISYSRHHAYGMRVYRHLRASLNEIPVDQVQIASVYLFWVRQRLIPQHIAIWEGRRIIHAYPEAKGVVRTTLGPYWSKRIFAAFDLRTGPTPNHQIKENELSVDGISSSRSSRSGDPSPGSGDHRGGSGRGNRHAGDQRDPEVSASEPSTTGHTSPPKRR